MKIWHQGTGSMGTSAPSSSMRRDGSAAAAQLSTSTPVSSPPVSGPSSSSSRSNRLAARRQATFQVEGLVGVSWALPCALLAALAFYLAGGVLVFALLTVSSYYVLMVYTSRRTRAREFFEWSHLEHRLRHGGLHFDDCLRFLVSKLARMWQSLMALQKSVVNYSFTVSIVEGVAGDDPSRDTVLHGRPLLLGYGEKKEGVYKDPRVRSYTDDDLAEAMEQGDRMAGAASASASTGLKQQEETQEEEDDDEDWEPPSAECTLVAKELVTSLQKLCVDEGIVNPRLCVEIKEEPQLPVDEQAAAATNDALPTASSSPSSCSSNEEAAIVPAPIAFTSTPVAVAPVAPEVLTKAVIETSVAPVPKVRWPTVRALFKKRTVSVPVHVARPMPRLVVKPRPSTLTTPQRVQRMLDDVEKMTREVNELLAAGSKLDLFTAPPAALVAEHKKQLASSSSSTEDDGSDALDVGCRAHELSQLELASRS